MDTLETFVAVMAEHLAHSRGWTVAYARAWVEARIPEARQEYRDAGAPLGDTDEGFIAWIHPRHQPPSA